MRVGQSPPSDYAARVHDEPSQPNAAPAPVVTPVASSAEVIELPPRREPLEPPPPEPRATSQPWVSYLLLGANILVWVVMVAFGVEAMEPSAEALLEWGGNLGLLTMHGQWWRLLTAMFLHAGLVHLAFNGYFLWVIGRVTELVFGPLAYALIYFGSGLIASMVSLYWQPDVVSVGASGALFGVFGAFLGITLRRRDRLPPEFVKQVRRNAFILIGINLAIGLGVPNIDMAAHIGGLAGGFGIGWLLARLVEKPSRSPAEHRRLRARAVAIVGSLTATLLLAGALLAPRYDDLFGVLERFDDLHAKVVTRYEEAGEDLQLREQVLEREVLPTMREIEAELATLERVPERARPNIDQLEEYASVRRQAFEAELQALQDDDLAQLEEAQRLHERAAELYQGVGSD